MKRAAIALLASLILPGAFLPRAGAQISRSGIPLRVPSLASQAINPNFQIAPGLTLPQAAFNISVIGQALRQVPPYAFGYNPYTRGGGYASMYAGGGYGAIMTGGGYGGAMMMGGGYGYGGGMMMGGGYGGGNSMSTPGYGGNGMTSPYATSTYKPALAAPYTSDSQATGGPPKVEGHLVNPKSNSLLVSASKPEHPETTRDIWIYDSFFSPATMTVKAGTTVRWINYGQHSHSVASQDGEWDSGPMKRGAEYSITLNNPGTYNYFCRYHPNEMTAKIVVTK
jgi:plastocyanin